MASSEEFKFPRSCNQEIWERYLGRKLTEHEVFILNDVKSEKRFNDHLVELSNISAKKNLYIPALTGLYGNCLFESLQILKLIDDHEEFRQDIAFVMKSYKNYKNFLPNQTETLGDLFVFMNDIEHVMDNKKDLYKYTYEIMYRDLSNGFSWTRLPTQLILMTISFILNIRIHIISNTSEYQHTIDNTRENAVDVYLGHIGEVHYVPLAVKVEGETYRLPLYDDARILFFKWGTKMEREMMELYTRRIMPNDVPSNPPQIA